MSLEIAERIVMIRKCNKLTQTQFGEKLSASRSKIASYEMNALNYDNAFLGYMCKVFNVNYEWLITGEGEMQQQDSISIIMQLSMEYSLDDLDRKIIMSYLELNARKRDIIKEFIFNLANAMKED